MCLLTEAADADLRAFRPGAILCFIVVVYDVAGIICVYSFLVYVLLQYKRVHLWLAPRRLRSSGVDIGYTAEQGFM